MIFGLTGSERRQMERAMREESLKFGDTLREIPFDEWTPSQRANPARPLRALRSRDFLVQVYNEGHHGVLVRLSINRARLNAAGTRWEDGITWDDLQRLKAEAGYADFDAVEVYPQQAEVVNVANVRHLWIMAEPLSFAWRSRSAGAPEGRRPCINLGLAGDCRKDKLCPGCDGMPSNRAPAGASVMAPCPHRFEARRAAAVSLLCWLAVWLAASITFYARFA